MRNLMRLLLAILLSVSTVLAGCLQTAPVEPAGDPTVLDLLRKPWLGDWTARSSTMEVDYDPENRHASVTGRIEIVNELGGEKPWVHLFLEALDVTRLTDENGVDLEYTVSPVFSGMVGEAIPAEALRAAFPLAVFNVSLPGAVGHGAVRTLHMEYAGWYDEGGPSFMAALDVPVHAPNELAQNLHLGLLPLVSSLVSTTEQRFVVRSPSSWVTLGAGGLVSWVDDGTTVTASYAVKAPYAVISSSKGLEWHEDDVGGINVRTYFFPDERMQGQVVHDVTRRILESMPEYSGPYPFDHIWTVPNAVVANAFSMPGLTFMGLNFYRFYVPNAPYQFGRFTPYPAGKDGYEMVIVHEHMHNWWGYNIAENNTNPRHGPIDRWLVEGVTTYLSETTWFQDQYGEEGAAWSARSKIADQYANQLLDIRRGRQPGEGEKGATEAGGDFYERTALALRSLEAYAKATGRPTATYDALKTIQARHGALQGGTGAPPSATAFAIFEEVFGEDLTWFWEQHFLSSNLPDLTVRSVTADAANLTVEVATGGAPSGVQVRGYTLTGREFTGWGVVVGEGAVVVPRPPSSAMEPIVRVELDPLHYVYESNEANNVWTGMA